jgi:hypothetical protein
MNKIYNKFFSEFISIGLSLDVFLVFAPLLVLMVPSLFNCGLFKESFGTDDDVGESGKFLLSLLSPPISIVCPPK